MKLVEFRVLASRGVFPVSKHWARVEKQVRQAIRAVVWPRGSRFFTIHPQTGKRRGEGSGVKPIKDAFVSMLTQRFGWEPEFKLAYHTRRGPGKIDAVKRTPHGLCAVEWETGNVSSSHRALNKIVLGIQRGQLKAGILVVPTRKLAAFLTDRVGNYEELEPYFDLWGSMPFSDGVVAIAAVEHDRESKRSPRIAKGTDGRALQ